MAAKDRAGRRSAVAMGVGLVAITVAWAPAIGAWERQTAVSSPRASSGLTVGRSRQTPTRGVRPQGREAEQLLTEARRRSPTVRRLLTELEMSDLFVYLELRIPRFRRTGQLVLLGRGDGARYLKIEIYGVNCPKARIPWLAHELQHAVEIAAAPDVTDDAGMRRFYQRIGRRSLDDPDSFETIAAIDVRNRVLAELGSPPSRLAANRAPR